MIGITLGEYFGIGPEILVKTYLDLQHRFPPCRIYGSEMLMKQKADELQAPYFWEDGDSELVETYLNPVSKGDTKSRAEYVLSTLNLSIEHALKDEISSIVTCPIDKSVVQRLLPTFTGHTEYLEEKSGVSKTVMLLNNREFSIALMTNHVSLRNVSAKLYSDNIEELVQSSVRSFSRHFHVSDPKVAVLGVNPHAGELDASSEEKQLLAPMIHNLRSKGMDIQGPFPADSFFPKARKEKWDIVFSPFHDQGLVAAKYNGLENVINVTLGMPFLRVSPGHGVAYDLVGKSVADHRSFERALLAAQKHTLDV